MNIGWLSRVCDESASGKAHFEADLNEKKKTQKPRNHRETQSKSESERRREQNKVKAALLAGVGENFSMSKTEMGSEYNKRDWIKRKVGLDLEKVK